MSKVVVTDQLSIYGDIDINYSPENVMLLLPALGELGFTPTTFPELDKDSSQVENRLSFIKDQIKINFHPKRIIIANAPDPSKALTTDFDTLSVDILKIILSKFPSINCSHCIRSGDYFAPEMKSDEIDALRKKFFPDSESEPVEWRARQTFANEENDDVIFYTTEIGRAQGLLNIQGNKTPFDRIRYKIVTQTDVASRSVKYDSKGILQHAQILILEHSKRLDQVELSINE